MDHSNVQQSGIHDERLPPGPRESVQEELSTYDHTDVDVITVCDSWWATRPKLGVHVLNPGQDKLTLAKQLAKRMRTYTVYVYKPMARRSKK